MSGLPILYSFRRCPYAIRARLALLASGTACAIREVRLSAKPAEMIAVSPKATVPVLVLPDGRVLDQSLDIMRWALGRSDPAGWLDRVDEALIAANDGPFKHHLDRAKYPDRFDEDPTIHRDACVGLLRPLEDRLARASNLCGELQGLTDAAILPFVRQFAAIDRGWFDAQHVPRVRGWLDRFLVGPLFEAALTRFAPWKPDDPEIRFPAEADCVGVPIDG
ncbi:glutathione S-transferase [Sphingomonas nostoxanthinifaciens]|uniref:glutathione S-transferase n=1 Tax=Sphingomonas nostoxanthinifaciens TaxID=2872652 RepID=UPI001CC1F06F|nr:glutathione S-transferase [Sphingomonas nostoxanthinifaciens]